MIPGPHNAVRTIGALYRLTIEKFRCAGLETAMLDARLLLLEATGLSHEELISNENFVPDALKTARFDEFVDRRLCHEPVHRIIGKKEFFGLMFEIPPVVLEPRADTEILVETVLRWVDARPIKSHPLRIVEIGTGSGAIILALLHELPNATGIATDISVDALNVARGNAINLDIKSRISFLEGDYFSPIAEKFDLIVSNPPYIARGEIETLAPEVRNFDPMIALDGGPDGLDAYRVLLAESANWLNDDGIVVFEIGHDQGKAVGLLAHDHGWKKIKIIKDYGDNDRVFTAMR